MWLWFKRCFCFHKWAHIGTNTIHTVKTEPPYFIANYRCTKCGKMKSKYLF